MLWQFRCNIIILLHFMHPSLLCPPQPRDVDPRRPSRGRPHPCRFSLPCSPTIIRPLNHLLIVPTYVSQSPLSFVRIAFVKLAIITCKGWYSHRQMHILWFNHGGCYMFNHNGYLQRFPGPLQSSHSFNPGLPRSSHIALLQSWWWRLSPKSAMLMTITSIPFRGFAALSRTQAPVSLLVMFKHLFTLIRTMPRLIRTMTRLMRMMLDMMKMIHLLSLMFKHSKVIKRKE